jgi:hypothetical protein
MPFGSLWLPVVVSAVAVWFLSAILHMVLKYHRADHRKLPSEDAVSQALRQAAPSPGVYFTPYLVDPSQLKDPAVRKRYEDGPVAIFTVMRNGVPAMGKHLLQWFVFCFLVSFATAYIARNTLDFGEDGLSVLRLTGAVAFLAYGFGYIQDSIWKGIPWANSLRGIVDAVLYALATGLIFRAFWPGA